PGRDTRQGRRACPRLPPGRRESRPGWATRRLPRIRPAFLLRQPRHRLRGVPAGRDTQQHPHRAVGPDGDRLARLRRHGGPGVARGHHGSHPGQGVERDRRAARHRPNAGTAAVAGGALLPEVTSWRTRKGHPPRGSGPCLVVVLLRQARAAQRSGHGPLWGSLLPTGLALAPVAGTALTPTTTFVTTGPAAPASGGGLVVQTHGQRDAFTGDVDVLHLDLDDVAGFDDVVGVLHELAGHRRDMDEPVLLDPHVHERAEGRDVGDHTLQDHVLLQVAELLHTLLEGGGGEGRAWVTAGLVQLGEDVGDRRQPEGVVDEVLRTKSGKDLLVAD